jgi:hypothetical protein
MGSNDFAALAQDCPLNQFVRNQFCFTFAGQNEKPGESEVQYSGKNNDTVEY